MPIIWIAVGVGFAWYIDDKLPDSDNLINLAIIGGVIYVLVNSGAPKAIVDGLKG